MNSDLNYLKKYATLLCKDVYSYWQYWRPSITVTPLKIPLVFSFISIQQTLITFGYLHSTTVYYSNILQKSNKTLLKPNKKGDCEKSA